MKRLISVLLVLALFLTMAVSFTACKKKDKNEEPQTEEAGGRLNGVDAEEGRAEFIESIGGASETYRGAVSEQSFATAQDAAKSYVQTEVVGMQEAVIESTVSKGELNASQISGLNLPEEISKGMQTVEQIEVEYSVAEQVGLDGSKEAQALPVASGKTKIVVYVIKYEVDWKYYVPCPVTGETISKSYYDSVFDNEKYKNCTLTSSMTMVLDVDAKQSGIEQTGSLEMTMTQVIKHADNRVMFEQTIETVGTGLYAGMESSLGFQQGTIRAYLEEENGVMKCYIQQGNQWVSGMLQGIGFSSVEELTPFHNQYLDYTYFTKTNFGFTLQDENAQKYLKTALAQLTAMLNGSDDWDYNMYSEYYVSRGVLSGMRTDVEILLEMNESGVEMTLFETVKNHVTCTNYGTTVVEKIVP